MSSLPDNSEDYYNVLKSRNYYYIEESLQNKIKSSSILFLGVGLSSMVAVSLVRLGFIHFTLVDNDSVELSNLNRQAYLLDDLEHLKVNALKKALLKINPYLDCKTSEKKINDLTLVQELIDSSDIIINTLDYGTAYFDVIEYARSMDKLVICPFNPCDSGLVVNFSKESQSIYDFLKTKTPLSARDFPIRLRQLYANKQFPKRLADDCQNIMGSYHSKRYFPQLILGAHLTTALVIKCLLDFLSGREIKEAPELMYIE